MKIEPTISGIRRDGASGEIDCGNPADQQQYQTAGNKRVKLLAFGHAIWTSVALVCFSWR